MNEGKPLGELLRITLKAAGRTFSHYSEYGGGGEYTDVSIDFEGPQGDEPLSIADVSAESVECYVKVSVVRRFDSCSANRNYRNKETTRRESRARITISASPSQLAASSSEYLMVGRLVEGDPHIHWISPSGHNKAGLNTAVSSGKLLDLLRKYPEVLFEWPAPDVAVSPPNHSLQARRP